MIQVATVGDTLKHRAALADFPASAGWVLHYRLTPYSPGDPITFDAAADGDDHLVTVAAGTTATWAPGAYTVTAWVTLGAERYSVPSESGQARLLPNPATLAAGTDGRSDAQRCLAAIQALLAGKASSGDEELRISGRALRSYPLPDLLRLEQHYKAQVDAELVAAGQPALYGAGRVRRMLVRMP